MTAPDPDALRLHRWSLATATALTAAASHTYRTHELYVARQSAGPWSAALVVAAIGAALVATTRTAPRAPDRSPWLLVGSAVATAASSFVPFLAFDRPRGAAASATACVVAASALLAASLYESARGSGRAALALGFVEFVGSPLRLLIYGAGLGAVAVASAHVGFLRSGLGVAAWLTVLGLRHGTIHGFLGGRRGRGRGRGLGPLHVAGLAVGTGLAVGAAAAARLVPLGELWRYPSEVVFTSDGAAHRFVVTASPGGYELFSDAQLVVASLDEDRRARALVGPVLDASAHPARVLLLHGGTGTVEREILRDGRVQGLTVVVDDAELVRLTHRMNWLSSRAHGALDAPRVALVVAEPATWLGAHAEEVDAIVDDLPFPTGHREGKYYTRYYLGLLSKHLAAGGAWVVPAASAFTASTAFSSVLATAGSVGVRASAYHTAIPSLGVTSFVVGSRDAPTRELVATQGVAFDLGKDLGRQTPGEISTLHDQRVVTAFETAREATEGPRSGE